MLASASLHPARPVTVDRPALRAVLIATALAFLMLFFGGGGGLVFVSGDLGSGFSDWFSVISVVEVSKREDERRAECDDLGSERKTLALFHWLDLEMNAITRRWVLVI